MDNTSKLFKKHKVSKEHVNNALEGYLKSLTILNDNETVTEVIGSGTHVTVITERERS